ncbi:hypothetical protein [Streptomyces sp. NRRL B-24484]|uniref:hypothetical protein n=1 Tax=Streptomyces sp. NRRL B-24484 TaxID=1463833 RepID=UPI0004C0D7A7|nr:hypothetical protein [Streptomyces sp. NRRL B-24484]
MPIFGRRRTPAPRLTPELDDSDLGRVLAQLTEPQFHGRLELSAVLVEQALRDAGADWDRRTLRLSVLAEAASPALVQVWRRQRPREADPLVFDAWVALAQARREGRAGDHRSLVRRCHDAAGARPEDPAPWLALLGVLRLLRRPAEEVYPVCREIGARDPWNRTAHLEMLGYLSPAECGSHAQELDFVDAVRAAAPAGSPVAGLELALLLGRYRAAVDAGGVGALGARRRWDRADAAAALDRARGWTEPGALGHADAVADLNVLAYDLVRAGRLQEAAGVFASIGPTVTAWPWRLDGEPLQQFTYRRDQVLAPR